jgi:hypothetical protein
MKKSAPPAGREAGGKSFWWPCPRCGRPHLSKIPKGAAVGDQVRIRCPVTGHWVEAHVETLSASSGSSSDTGLPSSRPPSSSKRSRIGEIRRWLRELSRTKE